MQGGFVMQLDEEKALRGPGHSRKCPGAFWFFLAHRTWQTKLKEIKLILTFHCNYHYPF